MCRTYPRCGRKLQGEIRNNASLINYRCYISLIFSVTVTAFVLCIIPDLQKYRVLLKVVQIC
jgi:hypothetical protein